MANQEEGGVMLMLEKIPTGPFMLIVSQFAKARGLKFMTWKQQLNAIELYMATAPLRN